MKRFARTLFALLAFCLLCAPAWAKRDPLSRTEADELRDVAQEPDKRIRLFAKFLRLRTAKLDELRTDPRFAEGRTTQIHDMVEDLTALIDEMDDNIDQYASQKMDIRKALTEVAAANSDLQTKLASMKQAGAKGASPAGESGGSTFVLDNALEAVQNSLDNVKKLMVEQEQMVKEQKEAAKKQPRK